MKKQIVTALTVFALLASPCLVSAAQGDASAPVAGTAPVQKSAPVVGKAAGQAVHGNPNSKIYHVPSCRYYNSKGASKVFKSAEEAGAAGYRPCKTCGGKGGA